MRLSKKNSALVYVTPEIMRGTHGVPNTVKKVSSEMVNSRDVTFVTWDSEFGGIRNLTVDEISLFGSIDIFKNQISPQPFEFSFDSFRDLREASTPFIILEPGPLIDHHLGMGTFRKIVDLAADSGLKVVCLVYDFIPLLIDDFPIEMQACYIDYLAKLSDVELVIPISNYVGWTYENLTHSLFPQNGSPTNLTECVLLAPSLAPESHINSRDNPEKRILCFGTVESRKNQILLIEAFTEVISENPGLHDWHLDFVGNIHPDYSQSFLKCVRKAANTSFFGPLTDHELALQLSNCSFTVFPSEEEGFGLPIVESLAAGKPCISANFGAMAEVSPYEEFRIDVRSKAGIKKKLLDWMSDSQILKHMCELMVDYESRKWSSVVTDLLDRINTQGTTFPKTSNDFTRFLKSPYLETLQSRVGLTIVISTYNRLNSLRRNLENLASLRESYDFEIFVLDNASTDGSLDFLSQYPGIKWYSNPVNVGMLGNLREVSKYLNTSHVWVIGDDDFINLTGIKKTLNYLDRYPLLPLLVHNFSVFYSDPGFDWQSFDPATFPSISISNIEKEGFFDACTIAKFHDNLFTAIYQFVWRTDVFARAFTNYEVREIFSDGVNSAPSASFLIDKYAKREVLWSSEIALVANGRNSWSTYLLRWHSVIIHEYLQKLVSADFDIETAKIYSNTHRILFLDNLNSDGDASSLHISKGEFETVIHFLEEGLGIKDHSFEIALKSIVR